MRVLFGLLRKILAGKSMAAITKRLAIQKIASLGSDHTEK
jgi:hypothetical protein